MFLDFVFCSIPFACSLLSGLELASPTLFLFSEYAVREASLGYWGDTEHGLCVDVLVVFRSGNYDKLSSLSLNRVVCIPL